MWDIVALGELLIDFTPAGRTNNENPLYEMNPGGAPANVLATLAKWGKKTAFIGKVGEDYFGNYLCSVLKDININCSGLLFSKDVRTTVAVVSLNNKGEREFDFYRNPGADMMLSKEELNLNMIKSTKIFHFGSVSMTDEPSRTATLEAVEYAKSKGSIISYDPNLRALLWRSLDEAKKNIITGLTYADILKISEEELYFITGINDIKKGSEFILNKYRTKWIFVTLGPKGCYFKSYRGETSVASFNVEAIDTTGAGDIFLASVLFQLLENNKKIEDIALWEMEEIVRFANAAAALTVTKRGAIPAIPMIKEIKELITKTIDKN